MPRAPSARIQARRERAAQANKDGAGRQVAQPNRAGQGNWRDLVPAPARANRRQEEEEVQQELIYEERAAPGTTRERVHKTKLITLGITGITRKKEGR